MLAGPGKEKVPLTTFVFYYLFGRDSVALSVLESRAQEILDRWDDAELSQDAKDIRAFWVISGLIECGAILDVESVLRKFKPSDPRLLLGIHLGCYLTQNVRVTTREQRESAKRICDGLAGRIGHLRTQLLEEMKTELLEVRQGAVKTLPARSTSDESGGQSDEEAIRSG
jgi:hypothetical protein